MSYNATDIKHREEVFNIKLADVLQERGIDADPERIENNKKPDIIISIDGLRIILEGKFNIGSNETILKDQCKKRLEQGLSHIVMGVLYPSDLKNIEFTDIINAFENMKMTVYVFYDGENKTYENIGINELKTTITHQKNNVIVDATFDCIISALMETMEKVSSKLRHMGDGSILRLEQILAMPFSDEKDQTKTPTKKANTVNINEKNSGMISIKKNGKKPKFTTKMKNAIYISSIVLINAMLFQEILSMNCEKVKPLKQIISKKNASRSNISDRLRKEWKMIQEEIDYIPIFNMAENVLENFSSSNDVQKSLEEMSKIAELIIEHKASLNRDLMGRVFHKFLSDAKFLGAFYTTLPAATLLSKLVVNRITKEIDWTDPESIKKLKISDPACGTGTLLVAILNTMLEKHADQCVEKCSKIRRDDVYKTLVECSIFGFDIITSAVHIAASTIAMSNPNIAVDTINTQPLPFGGKMNRLGSLEFLSGEEKAAVPVQQTLDSGKSTTERSTGNTAILKMPYLDVCIMNPPFSRSTYDNEMFGHDKERKKALRARLKNIAKNEGYNVQAGLATLFIKMMDYFMKADGILGIIIPKTILIGKSWEPTRKLIAENYTIDLIITSHEVDKWNFSETTKLNEVIIILKRACSPEQRSDNIVKFINLRKNPSNDIDASHFVNLIEENLSEHEKKSNIDESNKENLSISDTPKNNSINKEIDDNLVINNIETHTTNVVNNKEIIAQIISVAQKKLNTKHWGMLVAFSNNELATFALQFTFGKIMDCGEIIKIKRRHLKDMFVLGADGAEVKKYFSVTETRTVYKMLKGHNKKMQTLQLSTNAFLSKKPNKSKKTSKTTPEKIWVRKSGKTGLPKTIRLNTQRLFAANTSDTFLSNVWWPTKTKDKIEEMDNENGLITEEIDDVYKDEYEKILVIYLNSTLGIITVLGNKQETWGPWIKMPKNKFESLIVPDFVYYWKNRTDTQSKNMIALFEENCNKPLKLLIDIEEDDIRNKLDEWVAKTFKIDYDLIKKYKEILATEIVFRSKEKESDDDENQINDEDDED